MEGLAEANHDLNHSQDHGTLHGEQDNENNNSNGQNPLSDNQQQKQKFLISKLKQALLCLEKETSKDVKEDIVQKLQQVPIVNIDFPMPERVFPKEHKNRSHPPMHEKFQRKKSKKGKGKTGQSYTSPKDQQVMDSINEPINSLTWQAIVTGGAQETFNSASKLDSDHQELFLIKYQEAQGYWLCSACNQYRSSNGSLEMVVCPLCFKTFHLACTNSGSSNMSWHCLQCATQFSI